jgi:hypothetical protein
MSVLCAIAIAAHNCSSQATEIDNVKHAGVGMRASTGSGSSSMSTLTVNVIAYVSQANALL